MDPIYHFDLRVPEEVVDQNRHVNNVAYVQWMQEAAIRHSAASGCTQRTSAIGATWVVRTHRIDYLSPAFAGDLITIQTWVANFSKVRSLRKYKFLRAADGAMLAEGETEWVFVDAKTGRPRAIPDDIKNIFPVAVSETVLKAGVQAGQP